MSYVLYHLNYFFLLLWKPYIKIKDKLKMTDLMKRVSSVPSFKLVSIISFYNIWVDDSAVGLFFLLITPTQYSALTFE